MDERAAEEDHRWNSVMESLDLLFARMGEVDRNQQQMEAKVDISSKTMHQLLGDQQTLAKQMEITGQAVAQLTLRQMESRQEPPPSPTASEDQARTTFQGATGPFQRGRGGFRTSFGGDQASGHQDRNLQRNCMPKLSFPRFDGTHPTIWKDKCENYFSLLNVPESMWATAASLHMDDVAEKWVQVHKKKDGLGTWDEFMAAVQKKFGEFDYQHAINAILDLQQTATVEEYARQFENLQYQITMLIKEWETPTSSLSLLKD